MIITNVGGGVGNQMFCYAVGRSLACRLNTELRLDISTFDSSPIPIHYGYELKYFNISCEIATHEDVENIKKINTQRGTNIGTERHYGHGDAKFMPEVLDYPDNVRLDGCWQTEKYFIDIENTIRNDFTLKELGGPVTKMWLDKIRATDCAVSLHVRHNDYIISFLRVTSIGMIPIEYYAHCVRLLQQQFDNGTLFVFSDDLEWTKHNLHFGTPIHFVEGCERDVDEIFLMSQCKHNIIPHSTFAWWGAWLNQNPDKRVFAPEPWLKNNLYNHDIIPESWTKVPVNFNKIPIVPMPPQYSIIIFVDNHADTITACLASVLNQYFLYYEAIIIDDCSTDGSGEICRKLSEQSRKIRLIRMKHKLGRSAAWNLGIEAARGNWILFLDGADRITPYTFFDVHNEIEEKFVNVLLSVGCMSEKSAEDKSLKKNVDESCKDLRRTQPLNLPIDRQSTVFLSRRINHYLGTKIFRRRFLIENFIRFNESLTSDAELIFCLECLSKTTAVFVTPVLFYVKPRKEDLIDISNWQRRLDELMTALEKAFAALDNVNSSKRLELLFTRQYLAQLQEGL